MKILKEIERLIELFKMANQKKRDYKTMYLHLEKLFTRQGNLLREVGNKLERAHDVMRETQTRSREDLDKYRLPEWRIRSYVLEELDKYAHDVLVKKPLKKTNNKEETV